MQEGDRRVFVGLPLVCFLCLVSLDVRRRRGSRCQLTRGSTCTRVRTSSACDVVPLRQLVGIAKFSVAQYVFVDLQLPRVE